MNAHSIDSTVADALEVNFLCMTPALRKLNIAPFMITSLKKEMVERYNMGIAHYTVAREIGIPYFSHKNYYKRIINVDTLIKYNYIDSVNMMNYKNSHANK